MRIRRLRKIISQVSLFFPFSPTGPLPSLNLLKPARSCSLPSMLCSTKALKNYTELSLLPGQQSSCSTQPEPESVLFWQQQPLAHLTWCVLSLIDSHHKTTKRACGREWAPLWPVPFPKSHKKQKKKRSKLCLDALLNLPWAILFFQ